MLKMSSFRIGNKHYKIIPFLITTGTLLFFVFWIGGLAYKYHLETEERSKLQEVDIEAKARELNDDIYNENQKLKKENEYFKHTPYEFIRDNGEKEYYNLFTHKLVKKIDKDDAIWEYDKNNGLLLKKTDKYNNVEEYGSHGKLIKKTSFYRNDGKTLDYINEYDSQTGNIIKSENYSADGKTLDYIWIFSPQTGEKIKSENYSADGKTIDFITEYDSITGDETKTTYYNPDGTVKEESTY
ncbi:DUF2963 domain-containing protein [Paulownia witches'-broom phytoplasma]|uniref:DUF2963 domain-containing protein n=1 Tax=Paulownia witches'-broom phytoplasma TaxID=39647 RepID=UPI002D1F5DF9|nr:hypothetical protein PAWBP_2430 [Paulownia witches'-broom phytoplasma]